MPEESVMREGDHTRSSHMSVTDTESSNIWVIMSFTFRSCRTMSKPRHCCIESGISGDGGGGGELGGAGSMGGELQEAGSDFIEVYSGAAS